MPGNTDPDHPYAPPRGDEPANAEPHSAAPQRRYGCIGCAVVALLGTCGYPPAKLYWTRTQVESFCDEVKVGQPVAGLAERAEGMWLKVNDIRWRDQDPVLSVWEGWVFARRFCDVTHKDGVVTKKELNSLD